jgi:hypothetical protein
MDSEGPLRASEFLVGNPILDDGEPTGGVQTVQRSFSLHQMGIRVANEVSGEVGLKIEPAEPERPPMALEVT